jgi:Fe2+ or Zn2+ uptake regulation protein
LTYAQLEYNLPPLTASSSSSGRLNHHSLADILEILVATGLVQKVKEETTNTRYCMLQGIPRADVVHPTTVLDQIEAAHEEIKRSNERAQRLETLLAGSPKTTSHKEILKTLATDYPEILLDPVYVAALRSLHVDVGGGERERKVKSPSTAVKSPTAATAQANETAAAQANETTATVEQRKPQASSLASNKTTTPTTTSTAVKMAASASQTTAPAAVVPRVKDTPSTKPSLAKEDKESAGSLGGNDKSTNATLTDTVQKKAVVAEEKEQQSHPPEVAPSQSAIASNAPAIPSKPLPTDAIKVEVAIAVGDSATNETEQPGSGIDKAAIS